MNDTSSLYIRPCNAFIAASLLGILSLAKAIALSIGDQQALNPFPFSPQMSLFSTIALSLTSGALFAKLLEYNRLQLILTWLIISLVPAVIIASLSTTQPYSFPFLPESASLTLFATLLFCALILGNRMWAHKYILAYDMGVTVFTLIPLLTIFAYIFDPVAMYESYGQWVLPLPTAIGFMLAFVGLIGQTHSKGASGLLTRNSHYARNFRLLFLLVLIIPLSIGSSLALAVEFHYVRAGFATGIFCLLTTLLISCVLANNAIVQENWLKKFVREQEKNRDLQSHITEILELSSDAILLLDNKLQVLHANRGAAVLFGWEQKALQKIGFGTLVHNEHYSRFETLIKRFFKSRRLTLRNHHPLNVVVQNRLGEMIPASLNLSKRSADKAQHIVAVFRNTSETANKIHDLKQQLKIDVLTGANSRAEFEYHCAKFARSQRKNETQIAIMILDIDNFKAINDTYGHPTGDRVLQTLSRTTQRCLRNDDRLFRIGGEEFAIVASQINSDDAQLLAERIRTIIKAKPMVAGPKNIYVTCSIGVCLSYPTDVNDAIRKADEALYEAKHHGKDRVVVAD